MKRSTLTTILLVVLFSIGVFAAAETPRQRRIEKIRPTTQIATFSQHARLNMDKFRSAVEAVVRGHPRGMALLDLWDRCAHLVVMHRGRFLGMRTTARECLTPFKVAFAQQENLQAFSALLGFGRGIAGYHPWRRLLVMDMATPLSNPWLGFIGAHELSHVDDVFNMSNRLAVEEVRAFDLEFELINRWTGNAFFDALDTVNIFSLEDEARLNTLFPPSASPNEIELRRLVYRLAHRFRVAERDGNRNTKRLKERAYQDLVGQYLR